MAKAPPTFRPRWAPSAEESRAALERRRAAHRGTPAERGYDSAWTKASAAFRAKYPLCAYCWLAGARRPCDLVDHLYPHGIRLGRMSEVQKTLFWRREYWVSACTHCHNSFKAGIERKGLNALDDLAMKLGLTPLGDQRLREVVRSVLGIPF